MPLHFSRLRVGYPDPPKELVDYPNSWKVYTICNDEHRGSCTTRRDVGLLEFEDRKKARSAFITLLNRAQTGQPFTALYDEKRCHEAFEFDYDGTPTKIFRLRTGDVRIYFCYLPNKNIVLLSTKSKREDKLNSGEKSELEYIARSILQFSDPYNFTSRVI